MAHQISYSQTRLSVDNGAPIVIDIETAEDEVYTALSNDRRRATLCVLLRESVPIDLETLVEKVANQELPEGSDRLSDEQQKNIRLALYHNHLPKLEALDLIAFDTEERVVERVVDSVNSATV